ncbi:MAG: hypothetical protein PHU42_01615 [Patescibacteria group bacterium]|nr:hypothetical protein [Patescibacteria group bacterium]
MNNDNIVKIFETKVPGILKKAGAYSLEIRRNGLKISHKTNTGEEKSDILTNADLKVQEVILNELLKTHLRKCMLVSEENTRYIDRFAKKSNYLLSIDPIDGTLAYAKKPRSKKFQIIIQLKNQYEILITAIYYPAYDELLYIANDKVMLNGKKLKLGKNKSRSDIATKDDLSIRARRFFSKNGLNPIDYKSHPKIPGYIYLVKSKYGGFYKKNINAYDGLVWAHLVNAMGGRTIEIVSGKEIGKDYNFFNIKRETLRGRNRLVHPGEYMAIFNIDKQI